MVLSINKIKEYKLILSFLLIIILFLTFGIISLREERALGNFTKMVYDHPLTVSTAALNAALIATKMQRSMKDVVLANSNEDMEAALKAVYDKELLVYQQLNIVRDNISGKRGQILENQIRQIFTDWSTIRAEVIQLCLSGRNQEAIGITKEKGAVQAAMLESRFSELTSYTKKSAAKFLGLTETKLSNVEKTTIILTFAGFLLSALIATFTIYRVLKAEKSIQNEKNELQKALNEIKTLDGIIKICSYCKRIEDDNGFWARMEKYLCARTEAKFTHGICPNCMKQHFPDEYESYCLQMKAKEQSAQH